MAKITILKLVVWLENFQIIKFSNQDSSVYSYQLSIVYKIIVNGLF